MPLPTAFDGFVELSKCVSPTCLITFDRNRYSVPARFANRLVSLHIYPERLVVVVEGAVVCTHDRIMKNRTANPVASSMTGTIIWLWSSASRGRYGMAPHSWKCPATSDNCRI